MRARVCVCLCSCVLGCVCASVCVHVKRECMRERVRKDREPLAGGKVEREVSVVVCDIRGLHVSQQERDHCAQSPLGRIVQGQPGEKESAGLTREKEKK